MFWSLFHSSLTGEQAPDISGEAWFNIDKLPEVARARAQAKQPLRFGKELSGYVVLVDFWDYSCINCVRTLPYLHEWWERYKKYNFLIIGIHTPEFEFAKEAENVRNAVLRFDITYPVVSDPAYDTWRRYNNNVWPRELLVDAEGIIRGDHRGEGGYREKEKKIQELLAAIHPDASFENPVPYVRDTDAPGAVCYPTTPEIYLGYARGRPANRGGGAQGHASTFSLPDQLAVNKWALQGSWTIQPEDVVHARTTPAAEDSLALHYQATEVFAVMRALDQSEVEVIMWQDEKPLDESNKGEDVEIIDGKSIVRVREDRLYKLVKSPQHGEHVLRLATASDKLAIHTFTFGTSCKK